MKDAQVLGQVAVLIALRVAQAQFALQPGGGLADARQRHVHAPEDLPRLLEEHLSRGRQGDGAAVAVEQLCPDVFLQRAYLLGDRRLRNVLVHGRLGKAPVLRDGDKIAQLVQVQGAHLPIP